MCFHDVCFVSRSLHHGASHWNCIVFPGGERNCGVHELICVRKGRADQSSGRLTFDPSLPTPPSSLSLFNTRPCSSVCCVHCCWPVVVLLYVLIVNRQLKMSNWPKFEYKNKCKETLRHERLCTCLLVYLRICQRIGIFRCLWMSLFWYEKVDIEPIYQPIFRDTIGNDQSFNFLFILDVG